LNALLPAAIRVRAAEDVDDGFHARHLAQAKTYHYRICRDSVLSPFILRWVLHDPLALNFDAMREAARMLEGEHDFTSFAASTGSEEEDGKRIMARTIYNSDFIRAAGRTPAESIAEEWIYVVRGRSFLRHMVRKIVGTLLEVGRGRLTPEDIPRILGKRDRTCSGATAPPQGLCLVSVEYSDATKALDENPQKGEST
jgi:tRNA pseudouridine38-40 synthase